MTDDAGLIWLDLRRCREGRKPFGRRPRILVQEPGEFDWLGDPGLGAPAWLRDPKGCLGSGLGLWASSSVG